LRGESRGNQEEHERPELTGRGDGERSNGPHGRAPRTGMNELLHHPPNERRRTHLNHRGGT
jgi:hypothetical protein